MAMVRAGDVDLYVHEVGTGPPCLVMHGGLGIDHTSLLGLEPLADRLRLIYYDHRGNGRSENPGLDTITMPQLADDADALVDALGEEHTAVIGVSFGGFVALEYALRHPSRVDRLILIGTAAHGNYFPEIMAAIRDRNPSPDVIAALSSPPADDEAAVRQWRAILPLYLAPGSDVDAIRSSLADMKVDMAVSNRGMQIWSAWDVRPRLGEIRCPTLVLAGRYDYICPPTQGHIIADGIPGATLCEWDDCGHFMWLEQPARFFSTVREWLTGSRAP
jgi:proline iminopeptidase